MGKLFFKTVSMLLIVTLCASMFSACGSSETVPTVTSELVEEDAAEVLPEDNITTEESAGDTIEGALESPAKSVQHQLYFDIAFVSNVFFDKYGANIYMDGEYLDNIPHGEYYTKLLSLDEGTHIVTFANEEYVKANISYEIPLESDITFSCTLYADGGSIEVKDLESIPGVGGSCLNMPEVENQPLSEAINVLKEAGFVNISSKTENGDKPKTSWIVIEQSVSAGNTADKNEKILLICKDPGGNNPDKNLTIENSEDFASLASLTYVDTEIVQDFVEKYADVYTIEFDCAVYQIEKLADYKTRYLYFLSPVLSNGNIGSPMFVLENVGYYDFHFDKSSKPDSVPVGMKLRMKANIVTGNNPAFIYLEPVWTTLDN